MTDTQRPSHDSSRPAEPQETLDQLVEEFVGWWALNREGSVNRTYDYIDKLVKRLEPALSAVAAPPAGRAHQALADDVIRQVQRHYGDMPLPTKGSTTVYADAKLVQACLALPAPPASALGEQLAAFQAGAQAMTPPPPTDPALDALTWRCFHCDEVFTNKEEAREHFGTYLDDSPLCLIKGEDGGFAKRIRELEAELADALNERNEVAALVRPVV